MHTLYRAMNYRRIRLDAQTSDELAPVLLRDGRTKLVRWLGFISRKEARQRHGGKPVRLKISRVDGEDLSEHQWVQGRYGIQDDADPVACLVVPADADLSRLGFAVFFSAGENVEIGFAAVAHESDAPLVSVER